MPESFVQPALEKFIKFIKFAKFAKFAQDDTRPTADSR